MGKKSSNHNNIHGLHNVTRAVWVCRIVFVASLLAAAAVLGAAAYSLLAETETDLAHERFASVAERALVEGQRVAHGARLAVATMATTVATIRPNATAWPFVYVDGFEGIAQDMLGVAGSVTLGLAPLVRPDQRLAFEDYIYAEYDRRYGAEAAVGRSDFGKGIWRPGPPTDSNEDGRVRETETDTWGSPHDLFAPVVHMQTEASPFVLFNLHFDALRGSAVDRVLDCAQNEFLGTDDSNPSYVCGSITQMIDSFKVDNQGPSALFMSPVFPRGDPLQVSA